MRPAVFGLAFALACTASGSTSVLADASLMGPQAAPSPGALRAPGDAVVARVGDRAITVQDVERRIAQVPPFQLPTFGRTPEEIRTNFVRGVLVRDLLLSQGAAEAKLEQRVEIQERLRSVLRSALLARVRADSARDAPVTDDEIRAYYEANRSKFNSPPRIALWRILVATRGEAEAILNDLRADLSPKRWNDIARDKSLDKATSMRGGNLGFVAPDGATAEPGLKVDPRLVQAAAAVKDAEVVPEPVPEGDRFAVVWRRQSMKAVERTLAQETPAIRQVIAHSKVEARVKALIEDLRKQHLTEKNAELTELIDVSPTGDLSPVRRPGTLPSSRRAGAAPPSPAPRGGNLR